MCSNWHSLYPVVARSLLIEVSLSLAKKVCIFAGLLVSKHYGEGESNIMLNVF